MNNEKRVKSRSVCVPKRMSIGRRTDVTKGLGIFQTEQSYPGPEGKECTILFSFEVPLWDEVLVSLLGRSIGLQDFQLMI